MQRRCQRCGETLTAHQPEEEDYVRTLLVCPGCGRWYLRLQVPGGRPVTQVLPVPTLAELGVILEPMPAA